MDKLRVYFNRPHPLDSDWSTALKRAVGIGAIIVFILFVLAPFGMHQLKGMARFINALQFGAITAIVTFVSSGILPRFFPGILNPDKWTFWKELLYTLFTIMLIGVANAAFLFAMGYMEGDFLTLVLYFELYTLAVGVIPVVIFLSIDQNKQATLKRIAAENLSKELSEGKASRKHSSVSVCILGDAEKPELEVMSDEILYFSAGGNYVDIYLLNDGSPKRITIRSTLKNVWDQLPNPPFYDCHRSYIVNMDHVSHISGNARNYELQLEGVDVGVPVSRAKGADLKDRLTVAGS